MPSETLTPHALSFDTLVTYTYWALFFCIILPVGLYIRNRLSNDPVKSEVDTLKTLIVEQAQTTEGFRRNLTEAFSEIRDSLRTINDTVHGLYTRNVLDRTHTVKTAHNAIDILISRSVANYWYRVRLNHITQEKHKVYDRYNNRAEKIAKACKDILNCYTFEGNDNKLGEFFGYDSHQLLSRKISDELFRNHWLSANNDPEALNEDDLNGAMARIYSHLCGAFENWLNDETNDLENAWDELEKHISLKPPINTDIELL